MKVAVFGKNGQVATELQRRVPEGVTLEVIGRDRADFSLPEQVLDVASSLSADAVINAVAYTAVDKAQSEPELANTVNGASVAALAEGCKAVGAPLVHISTDYVFPGHGETPWTPEMHTDPLGVYGASKLQGEYAIGAANHPAVVLRTSWVFSAHGENFVKKMLVIGAENESRDVVFDQVGGPTPAADIADACFKVASTLVNGHAGGIYHFSGAPNVSWAEFAREIFAQAKLDCVVNDVPSTKFPTPAKRPPNSRLDCSSLEADFGITRPDWKAGLADVLKDLSA